MKGSFVALEIRGDGDIVVLNDAGGWNRKVGNRVRWREKAGVMP